MPAYSSTPLSKKLGLKPGVRVYIYNCDLDYFRKLEVEEEDYHVLKRPKVKSIDFIHGFVKNRTELHKCIKKCKPLLALNGMMWISWPKGASGIQTDLNRDILREDVLTMGLVDVKVASFDNTWSGLKFVYRLKDR